MTETNTSSRFAVDTEGMRELHAARPAWHLLKELVQNAWDEYPAATWCSVLIEPHGEAEEQTVISVEDNGDGFRDLSDAYTLMASTPKRYDPKKRGRFNIGEKEILSVALSAEIETVGNTVIFPESGGRKIKNNSRQVGTKVTVIMPWGAEEREDLEKMLQFFIAEECTLDVNGKTVKRTSPLVEFECTLPTVLQSSPGKPVRPTARKTAVKIYETLGADAWIYEMGIPVQKIDCRWDVNVEQKIPMPPNRDTVGKAYLKDIAAEVLNHTYQLIESESFDGTWIRTALEDDRITSEAAKTAVTERYGKETVLWSRDRAANMEALDRGYQIVHPKTMSPEERDTIKKYGLLQSAKAVFGTTNVHIALPVPLNQIRRDFVAWVQQIAQVCGIGKVSVQFINAKTSTVASCSSFSTSAHAELKFNMYHLDDNWLSQRGGEQAELVLHELAHAVNDGEVSHGPQWGREFGRLFGIVVDNYSKLF